MNILNKLNQADRKKIEKRLKDKYIDCYKAIKMASKNIDETEDIFYAEDEWNRFLRLTSRINGMKDIMDIFGIDYSDWEGKI